MTVELLVDARANLGECPLWCDWTRALFWTDIEGQSLSRWTESDQTVRTWTLPDRVGSFALCTQPDHLLLGLAGGIALFNLDTGAMSHVVTVDIPTPEVRINDGRCDAQGRFVFGLFNGARDNASICPFYRVTAKLEIERLPLPLVCVANSIAFSPSGTLMYFTDSWSRQIQCVDYHAGGRVGSPRPFVQVPEWQGFPDGSAVDSEGNLWSAQWDGGAVVRYDPGGAETMRIALPASRPTCPSFGAKELDRLFVTTARIGLDEASLSAQPTAGGVFALPAECRGLPEHRFATEMRV